MPKGVYKKTEEHKRKISEAKKGKPRSGNPVNWKHTEEAKIKIGLAGKGNKYSLGRKHTEEEKNKIRLARAEQVILPFTDEHKIKISNALKGKKRSVETNNKHSESMKGEKHWRWIEDRNQLQKSNDRRLDVLHREWRLKVFLRDNRNCKINNQDCSGRIEVHHILNWIDYPELRYDINNGITLCHFHHPIGRKNEKRMSPYFQELLIK